VYTTILVSEIYPQHIVVDMGIGEEIYILLGFFGEKRNLENA
jgi:hypothetical protein